MFGKAKTKAEELSASAQDANAKADKFVDPVAARVVASRYTVLYVVLAGVICFAAGFTLGGFV